MSEPWKPTIPPEPPFGEAFGVSRPSVSPPNATDDSTPGVSLSETQPTGDGRFVPKGRRIHPRDLMGAAEVCELVGWKQRKSILDAMRTGGFPEPSARLKGGAIWDGGKVRKWLARRERIRRNPQGEPSPGDIWRAAKEEQADQNG